MRGVNVCNSPTVAVFRCTAGSTEKVVAVRVFLDRAFCNTCRKHTHAHTHAHIIQNATPPSCAKHHDAKPEVLSASLYSAWYLVVFVLPSILSFLCKTFSILKMDKRRDYTGW